MKHPYPCGTLVYFMGSGRRFLAITLDYKWASFEYHQYSVLVNGEIRTLCFVKDSNRVIA